MRKVGLEVKEGGEMLWGIEWQNCKICKGRKTLKC